MNIPIIAIDGPSASGKGTIARKLAEHYGFHYLNSGAIYRLIAYAASKSGIPLDDTQKLIELSHKISPTFSGSQVLVDGIDLWPEISRESVGKLAPLVAHIPELRQAIIPLQRAQIISPGFVAEGRDMTSVVFPDASIKIYLDVSPEEAARRRHKDEQSRNSLLTYEKLLEMMHERNKSDRDTPHGKLQLTTDSRHIDTSNLTREDVFDECLKYCEETLGKLVK